LFKINQTLVAGATYDFVGFWSSGGKSW
jgi:hypothetical protein